MEHRVWQPGKSLIYMNIYREMDAKVILYETVYLLSVKIDWYALENITHRIEILNSWNG